MEFLKKYYKLIIALAIIASLICAVIILYVRLSLLFKERDEIERAMLSQKQLNDNIVRSQTQYATKDQIEALAKDQNVNLKVIKDDLSKLDSKIQGINAVQTSSKGYVEITRPTERVIIRDVIKEPIQPGEDKDPFGYLKKTQFIGLSEKFENVNIPIGDVGFSSWKKDPWSTNIYDRTYKVTTVIGTNEEGKHYTYNKFVLRSNNKDYDVKIQDSKFLEEYPNAKFNFWNPRLYMGFDSGVNVSELSPSFSPGLFFGFISYGKLKNEPILTFAQLGVGVDIVNKKPNFLFSPINYNIGKHLPFMNNLFIGPSVLLNTNKEFSISLSLKVGL